MEKENVAVDTQDKRNNQNKKIVRLTTKGKKLEAITSIKQYLKRKRQAIF